MRHILSFLLIVCANFALTATFTGTYKGSQDGAEFTLELAQQGTTITGTAKTSGAEFKLSGSVSGQSAEGDITIMGEKLRFRSTLNAEGLEMKIADLDENGKADSANADTISFKRIGEAPNTEQPKAAGKLLRYSKEPTEVLKSGKEYTHASGGKMRYPANWKLEELEQGLKLTPPRYIRRRDVLHSFRASQRSYGPGGSRGRRLLRFNSQRKSARYEAGWKY